MLSTLALAVRTPLSPLNTTCSLSPSHSSSGKSGSSANPAITISGYHYHATCHRLCHFRSKLAEPGDQVHLCAGWRQIGDEQEHGSPAMQVCHPHPEHSIVTPLLPNIAPTKCSLEIRSNLTTHMPARRPNKQSMKCRPPLPPKQQATRPLSGSSLLQQTKSYGAATIEV